MKYNSIKNGNTIKSIHRKTCFTITFKGNEYHLSGESIEPNCKAKKEPQNEIDPIMWQVVLKKCPDENYFKGHYKRVDITKKVGIDKGHFIPESFMKYLIPNYDESIEFTFKNNGYNISEQSKNSNRGNTGIFGQLQYEQKILTHFNNNGSDVYFEIEEIFDDSNAVLGRRIYTHYTDPQIEDWHVFIPETLSIERDT